MIRRKKILFVLFITICFINMNRVYGATHCDWSDSTQDCYIDNLNIGLVKEEIKFGGEDFKNLVEGDDNYKYYTIQGFTITDKYFVFAITNKITTYVIFMEKDTYEVVKTIKEDEEHQFGYADDFAYNSKTGNILIPYYKTENNVTNYYMTVINIKKDGKVENLDDYSIETISLETNFLYNGITFDNDLNKFLVFTGNRSGSNLQIFTYGLNEHYESENRNNNIEHLKLTTQGFAYYDRYIYMPYFECGRNNLPTQSVYFNENHFHENIVSLYDVKSIIKNNSEDDNTEETTIKPTKSFLIHHEEEGEIKPLVGELENVSFNSYGEMFLAFNTNQEGTNPYQYLSISFYKMVYEPVKSTIKLTIDDKNFDTTKKYIYKLVDTKGNVVQQKENNGTSVVFDDIEFDNGGVYDYTIVDVQTNKNYNVSNTIKGEPHNLKYVDNILYDGKDSLIISYLSQETNPNTGDNIIFYCILSMIGFIGIVFVNKLRKYLIKY